MLTKTIFVLLIPVVVICILGAAILRRITTEKQTALSAATGNQFDPIEALNDLF